MRSLACLATTLLTLTAVAQDDPSVESDQPESVDRSSFNGSTFPTLRARSIGPALLSGRISDFAVNPNDNSHYFVAVSSGGVWETTDGGVTYRPVFDSQKSFSIGVVEFDPNDPNVIWVGTGENNSQRSVAFGDGVYKSVDGGRSWTNVGLPESEHIGSIIIDPRDSDTVFVAAQGPLWRAGGDRGLYKTTDGGKTWRRVLHASEDTGVNEVVVDPDNLDRMYASTYQRRRRQWTLIDGGPESAIYRSDDAGETWEKASRGLPGGDVGRIGLAISEADNHTLYAIVTATGSSSGFYRSQDGATSWERMSGYKTSSPQYYNEIVADPHNVGRVYLMDTFMQVSEDAGRTWEMVPSRGKHVDAHALWINPDDEDHLISGVDGGIYESFNRGNTWRYAPNLPITQFYKVAVDYAEPFYNVYGGTQDNNTLGGPSQTFDRGGIRNEHWFVTVGGDGFEPAIDPTDPNIVYSQWQYGNLIRHDRLTGAITDIKPAHVPGEPAYVWNWDSPLLISPHDHKRLYFAGNMLFRSDDRGNSWTRISDILHRGEDRNTFEVMGKVQPPEAVDKDLYTSTYGTAVSLSESPLVEDLIYVGTDDGLIHVTEDAGQTWRKVGVFPGVPHKTYVSDLEASRHHPDRVYAAFNNHKSGDFHAYLLVSNDRGQTWEDISGDLSDRDFVWALSEDHELEDLLFVGTEFGAYWTLTSGDSWHKIRGVPTISVRDVEIQRRENDLVMATFGRSFYILDDYEIMRQVTKEHLGKDYIFPIEDVVMFPMRSRGLGSQGQTMYSASNPRTGAIINYNLKSGLPKSLAAQRKDKARRDATFYPSIEERRAEAQEQPNYLRMLIRDSDGNIVSQIRASEGMNQAVWNCRIEGAGFGYTAPPGTYSAELVKIVEGVTTSLGEPREFNLDVMDLGTFQIEDHAEVLAFQRKVDELGAAVSAAGQIFQDAQSRLGSIKSSIMASPQADQSMLEEVHALQIRFNELSLDLYGDRFASSRMYATVPGINERLGDARGAQRSINTPPTQTMRDQYQYAGEAFKVFLDELRTIVQSDLPSLEERLDEAGARWTPGRFPDWDFDDGGE